MKEFSVPMALVDYIPVVLYLLGLLTFYKDLKHKNKVGSTIYIIGGLMVFFAGAFKASYKLLYALKVGDFTWMTTNFFLTQAFGFMLTGIGVMIMVGSKGTKVASFIPTMALVGIMVLGLCATNAGLSSFAAKLKKKGCIVLLVLSFFCNLTMGYLSTKNFDGAAMNWLAQGINTAGMLMFFVASKIMHKAGLAKI